MDKQYILSFDQGTTSSRAMVFDKDGNIVGQAGKAHEQIYPNPGWVSHHAEEIYQNIVALGKQAVKNASAEFSDIAAIGITNQRETLVAWDKETGEPACDAVVWQCRRSVDICKKVTEDGMSDTIRKKTGLVVDPYFTATKIRWVLDHENAVKELLDKGRLLVGTIDSFLIWKLTGGKKHVTDYSNASRTMLFNINTLKWDQDLLEYFQIPQEILPEIVTSSGVVGQTDEAIFGHCVPIAGIAGDQPAALFGQMCTEIGDVKNTYGTGCFMLVNIGDKPIIADGKLLTTIAWNIDGKTTYALEGSSFNAGSTIEWLINEAQWARDVEEINEICDHSTDTNGVYFVPAFSGLGTPYWDTYARGTICGMSLSTNRSNIVRAAMEGIAYQVKDVLEYMRKEAKIQIKAINVDGGASHSDFLMQFQADISDVEVVRPQNIETTALGAAYLAGLAVSFWPDYESIKKQRKINCVFKSELEEKARQEKYTMWINAVGKASGWLA